MSVVRAEPEAAAIRPGSVEHRKLLARFFIDTHVDYVAQSIDWPALSPAERTRLTGLPFWQEALSTENVTSNTVTAAVEIEPDPEVGAADSCLIDCPAGASGDGGGCRLPRNLQRPAIP